MFFKDYFSVNFDLWACIPAFVRYAHHIHAGPHGGQRALDPLELESQMAVSYHEGSWNQILVLCTSVSVLSLHTISQSCHFPLVVLIGVSPSA